MNWSPQQSHALDAVKSWYENDPSKPFLLQGYAGTGKTTLAKHIAYMFDGFVPFVTFTGKAASVLRKKGCDTATTIHRMIYLPKVRSRKTLQELEESLALALASDDASGVFSLTSDVERERERLQEPSFRLFQDSEAHTAEVIIVDESSMVDERLGTDLASFGRPIIALGDPGQLPPVGGRPYFTGEPDVLLDEIHRQAKDDPIIHLATLARRGERIPFGEYGASRVVPWGSVDETDVLSHNQILVGRNATRTASNNRMREILGHSASVTPRLGERLVCCRNNHDIALMNGSTWEVTGVDEVESSDRMGLTLRDPEDPDGEDLWVEAYTTPFSGAKIPFWDRDAEIFDFGYTLSVHRAQGSEWPSVLVFDESSCFRQDASKHRYTALTRAKDRVTLVI